MKSKEEIFALLQNVTDPEVPVLSILDLGIVRDIILKTTDEIEVVITPTYSGCPAMSMIAFNIKMELVANGFKTVTVSEVLSPAWTTDWMSEEGKKKLNAYGIAPPQYTTQRHPNEIDVLVPCTVCNSAETK